MELPQLILGCLNGTANIPETCAIAEALSKKFDTEEGGLDSTFIAWNPCARTSRQKSVQVRRACFDRIRAKLAVMRIQLLTIKAGGQIDSDKIGDVGDLSKSILNAALVGQSIDDDSKKIFTGSEFASVRGLAAFVVETI